MSWPQPTPQYGQIERATFASSMRACIARVLSDIDSSPVPSLCSRICRMSGHFESRWSTGFQPVWMTGILPVESLQRADETPALPTAGTAVLPCLSLRMMIFLQTLHRHPAFLQGANSFCARSGSADRGHDRDVLGKGGGANFHFVL